MNSKHKKTLIAIYTSPTPSSILFQDIVSLVKSLGGFVVERAGSRVKFELKDERWMCHKPHPGKEAKRYQVEEAREFLTRSGIHP